MKALTSIVKHLLQAQQKAYVHINFKIYFRLFIALDGFNLAINKLFISFFIYYHGCSV